MGNLTGLSPVIIFTSLLLGAKIAGLLGVILAIPLTGVVKSIAEVVLDPTLPPQTGSFFYNPLDPETLDTATLELVNSDADGGVKDGSGEVPPAMVSSTATPRDR